MKRISIIWLSFLFIIAVARGSNPQNVDIESAVRSYFKNDGVSRVSGKGTYIHTVYKKAVDVEHFLKGMELKDEEQKQTYIRRVQIDTGLDFSLTKDEHTYTVEKYCYDNDKVRKDISKIDAEKAVQIRGGRLSPDGLKYKTSAFDGDKTVSLFDDPVTKPTIISTAKIWVPDFRQFGLVGSGNNTGILSRALDTGMLELNGYRDNEGIIHATLELKTIGMRVEFLLDPQNMMMRSTSLYMADKLVSEDIASEYAKSDSGEWYPQRYATKKYADIDGQNVLTYLEEYTAIPGSVDFNIPIEPNAFSPKIPDGLLLDDTSGKPILSDIRGGVQQKHGSAADKK